MEGVTIIKIFALIYFMFQVIWIILGGVYLLVKIYSFGELGRPPPLGPEYFFCPTTGFLSAYLSNKPCILYC